MQIGDAEALEMRQPVVEAEDAAGEAIDISHRTDLPAILDPIGRPGRVTMRKALGPLERRLDGRGDDGFQVPGKIPAMPEERQQRVDELRQVVVHPEVWKFV